MKNRLSLIFCLLISLYSLSQNAVSNRGTFFTFGNNATYCSDWKHKPFNFSNPEIRYKRIVHKNKAIGLDVNAFYGEAGSKDITKNGEIYSRLILSSDFTYSILLNHFSAKLGPSVRYRNEKIYSLRAIG